MVRILIVKTLALGLLAALVLASLMTVVIGAGLIAGGTLNYLFPAVGLGSGVTIGVLSFAVAAYCFNQFVHAAIRFQEASESDSDESDEDEYDETISDEQVEVIAQQVSESIVAKMSAYSPREFMGSRRHRH